MSIATSRSPRYPDLLFISPALEQLEVVACLETKRDLQILWHESRQLPEQASLQSRLIEIGKLHVLLPETRTVLLVPPGIGGLFSSPSTAAASANPGWCMRQLELFVPYRINEIRYIVRYADGLAQFFWIPATWLDNQIILFNKLGLKLSEIYPRALLLEGSLSGSGYSGILSEKLKRGEFLYEFDRGHVCQAMLRPVETDLQESHASLGARGKDSHELTVTQRQGAPNWEKDLPVLWWNTQLSLPVSSDRLSLWSPFFRIAAVMVLILATLIGVLNWQITAKEEVLAKATRERKTLSETAKRFSDLEQTLQGNGAIVTAIKNINAAPTPLTLLAELTRILPKKAWVQQLTFDGKSIVVSGQGIGDEELIVLFQDAGFSVEKMRQEPIEQNNEFRLRVAEKPKSAEAISGGAS